MSAAERRLERHRREGASNPPSMRSIACSEKPMLVTMGGRAFCGPAPPTTSF